MPRRRGKTSSRLRGKFHRLDASAAICEMSVNANYMNPKITYIERGSKSSGQLTLPHPKKFKYRGPIANRKEILMVANGSKTQ